MKLLLMRILFLFTAVSVIFLPMMAKDGFAEERAYPPFDLPNGPTWTIVTSTEEAEVWSAMTTSENRFIRMDILINLHQSTAEPVYVVRMSCGGPNAPIALATIESPQETGFGTMCNGRYGPYWGKDMVLHMMEPMPEVLLEKIKGPSY